MNIPDCFVHPIAALRQLPVRAPVRAVEVAAFAIITILLMAAPASAHDRDGWEHDHYWREHHRPHYGWGPAVRYVPPPVYVAPRPVIVAPPAYYAPPPAYYAPAPSLNVVVPLKIR